ncbi:MAG: site-2 protease family protein [Candidatus Sungbacteria bacterium]|nr:site-2 protease family protein [Candidatus Sungbacteria bacterium]
MKTLVGSVEVTVRGLGILLKDIFVERKVSAAVSGPVGIFFFARDTMALGFSYVLQFIGMLSVNLAILNFLPIPALDGGRILFLLIEKVRGRRIAPSAENFAHALGFAFLVLIMILVTYKDIVRIF